MSATRDPVFGCLLWTERVDSDGYGRVGSRKAHIVAWESENGPVPDGMELDHTCRRRNCLALDHLEPVTRGENERRKVWARRAKQQQCKRGHEMRTNRVVTPEGGVLCRSCIRIARGEAA